MISMLKVSEIEMDDLNLVDPFVEFRGTLKIKRNGSLYNVSYIDINEEPEYTYTILCVHGWGSSSLIYSFLLKKLSPYFRIIAYDMKGHGFSDKESDSYDLDLFTEELAQLIDYFNPEKLVLIGHSMGTAVIQNYMCLNPSRVKSAIVMSSAPDFREPFPRIIPMMFFRMDERVKKFLILLGMNLIASNSAPDKYLDVIMEQRLHTPYHVFRNSLLNTVYAWKKGNELKNLDIPILLMVGEKDHLTSVKDSIKLRQLLPNSRLIILPDTKHDIVLERGKEVSSLVKEFIEYQIDLEKIN